jgi:2,3-diketo-5-methylthio-1-phosphopentane phosphatase
MRATVFVDFDGTITEHDLLDRIAQTFGDPDVYREVDEALDEGRISLNEVLRREFEPVRAPLDEVVAWVLAHASIRSGFRELLARARERGWRVVIVSSGFRELIEPVLEREGISGVELLSNRVEPDPGGWRVHFRVADECDVCGEPCKRHTVRAEADGGLLVYVGDGFSDRCGAKACDLVFARRGLAAHLAEEGVPFEPFEDFFHVADRIEEALSGR